MPLASCHSSSPFHPPCPPQPYSFFKKTAKVFKEGFSLYLSKIRNLPWSSNLPYFNCRSIRASSAVFSCGSVISNSDICGFSFRLRSFIPFSGFLGVDSFLSLTFGSFTCSVSSACSSELESVSSYSSSVSASMASSSDCSSL